MGSQCQIKEKVSCQYYKCGMEEAQLFLGSSRDNVSGSILPNPRGITTDNTSLTNLPPA